ncbi:ankyrin repeat domain-containing protein 34A [Pogoniulus pusillus]|uniref:ankyrin repeat domain-containing protein 34A n=1 Tax=Pogoniulus pusillus TaxID=488313 RepID=UPI0030B95344
MPSPVRRSTGPAAPPPTLTTLPVTDGSALLRAVSQGKFRLTRLLLEGGAYINEGNAAGQTPLMAACRAGYAEPLEQPRMVRYLLENGADPNIPDKTGMTALMHACAERTGPEVASVLLAHGADPSVRDYAGASALVYAINRGDREMLKVLLDACKARGKEVIIITTDTSPSGTKTTRQYLNSPPSPGLEEEEEEEEEEKKKKSPGFCMSPSDIEVRTVASPAGSEKEEERDVFCFPPPPPPPLPPPVVVATATGGGSEPPPPPPPPPPPRCRGRPLKRLNSEPWGLTVAPGPEGSRAAPPERLTVGLEGLSLGGRPRRHSVEGREAAGLLPAPAWTERAPPTLARRNTAPEPARVKPPRWEPPEKEGTPWVGSPPPSPGPSRRCIASAVPKPLPESPPGSLRRPAGLLERRGSGTLLLEPLGSARTGFLPPLPPGPHPPRSPRLAQGAPQAAASPLDAAGGDAALGGHLPGQRRPGTGQLGGHPPPPPRLQSQPRRDPPPPDPHPAGLWGCRRRTTPALPLALPWHRLGTTPSSSRGWRFPTPPPPLPSHPLPSSPASSSCPSSSSQQSFLSLQTLAALSCCPVGGGGHPRPCQCQALGAAGAPWPWLVPSSGGAQGPSKGVPGVGAGGRGWGGGGGVRVAQAVGE